MMDLRKGSGWRRPAAVCACVMMLAGGAMTYLTDSETSTSALTVSNSGVNVVLQDFADINFTTDYQEPASVLPGDAVRKVTAVRQDTAANAPCWVRARISFEAPEGSENKLKDSDLIGLNTEEWTKRGDWYYLKKGLTEGNTDWHRLFSGVQVPASWNSNTRNLKNQIKVEVEAIQQEHVTQDLDLENPWTSDPDAIADENGSVKLHSGASSTLEGIAQHVDNSSITG